MLELKNLSFSYKGQTILDNVSLALTSEQIVTLIGLSGSGKTTLFKLITGILEPQQGEILVDGKPLAEAFSNITYMMQEDLLLPWRSVLANLTLTSELGPDSKDLTAVALNAKEILREVGLEGKEHLFPDELSGGMKQRVSIARALLQNRPWILLDEPFGALDVIIREQMYALLLKLKQKYKKTIFLITHDFRDALILSNTIYLLDQGQIKQKWSIPHEMENKPEQMVSLQDDLRQAILNSYALKTYDENNIENKAFTEDR